MEGAGMSLNFGDVITQAWKITWKHKSLWGASFVMTFAMYLVFPLMFVPWFMIMSEGDPSRWFDNPLPWVLMGLGFLATFLISYGFTPLIRAALIVGVLKAERGAEKVSFREIFSDGKAFYLRMLGLMLLYAVTIMLVIFVFNIIQIMGVVLTMGLATICLMPLTLLMYPLMFAAMAWMELAESAIVVENLGVMDACRRGWEIMRMNKVNILVIALIVYLGVGMVTSLFIFPFMLPMFFAPIFFMEGGEITNGLLWGAGIWMALFIPVTAIMQGIGMVFMKSAWLIGYLRMSVKPAEEIVVVTETNG
jgi:hypothetical protein